MDVHVPLTLTTIDSILIVPNVGSSMKDAVRLGTWVATDGGLPQDRIGLNSRDYKSDTADQGHNHKMAVTYADVVRGRAKAHSSRKI